jgi:hypothetical protein
MFQEANIGPILSRRRKKAMSLLYEEDPHMWVGNFSRAKLADGCGIRTYGGYWLRLQFG